MLNFSFLETYMYAMCSNGSRNTFVTRAGRAAPNLPRAACDTKKEHSALAGPTEAGR